MTQEDRWFKFAAYNSQTYYGWGNEEEADRYANLLNASREINVYGHQTMSPAQVAEARLDEGYGEQVNLEDELWVIRETRR